ncbi:unnamed protein product [Miscanthus lutarioriparius]|uniref:NBR1 n=1 Tax=Miscanthus lutarioriparius TaxID=422564 RepID=A0A811PVB3_9POAL|nr:unnamed protein product [Miscanthus lutarioriparius]
MSDRSSSSGPMFFPFGPQAEAWDVTFKVKYGDTLKRFYGCVNGNHFDMNLSSLRAKIATAFKFGPHADFVLTYTDEDGDIVMLDDDDDLCDAALRQKLNPLRITVQLKKNQPTEKKDASAPVKPTAQDPLSQIMSAIEGLKPVQEDGLAHIKSAIGEAIKSIPEPIPDALAKLSHEILDAAPPPLAELMKPFAQLMAPNSNGNGPSHVHAEGSSSSSSGVTQTQAPAPAPAEAKNEPKVKPSLGLRAVLKEAAAPVPNAGAPQVQQPSMYPSVEELLFPCNSVDKSVCKGKTDAQNKGKTVMSSVTQPAPYSLPTHAFQNGPDHEEANNTHGNMKTMQKPLVILDGAFQCTKCPMHHHLQQCHPRAMDLLHIFLIQAASCLLDIHTEILRVTWKTQQHVVCIDGFSVMAVECNQLLVHVINLMCDTRVLMKSKREKLESRFILDVTVLDGTLMTPSTPFTKIWRMHNNGSVVWPLGTQLIWVGGDQFALQTSVPLEIPVDGFPVDKEIDVAVDFVAPTRPGRFISYWRLASPSGQKFGQRVWVHIQVEDPSFVNDNNRNAAINLNLPPESNSANTTNLIDVNIEPVDSALSAHAKRTKEFHFCSTDVSEPKKSLPTTLVGTSLSAPAPANPTGDVSISSTSAAAFVPSVNVPMPEVVTTHTPLPAMPVLPTNIPISAPVSAPAIAPVPASGTVPVPPPVSAPPPVNAVVPELSDLDVHNEEKLLRELEEMGFRQIDLNKEILRQNNYNLEQSVDDLCGVNEWDPLLAELEEMGFDDTEVNKELLAKNGGSIKRAVMDLIAREKKDK